MSNEMKSPAFILIEHVYENQGYQMGRSRERIQHGISAAVKLAIGYGLQFALEDFKTLATPKRPSYHVTSIYLADEYDYALACGCDRGLSNISAALSYEAWKGRKPFLIADENVTTPTRIYVGRGFVWYGQRVKCTSFTDGGGSLVACSHKVRSPDAPYSPEKIDRRYTITREAIAEHKLHVQLSKEVRAKIATLPKKAIAILQREFGANAKPSEMSTTELKRVQTRAAELMPVQTAECAA